VSTGDDRPDADHWDAGRYRRTAAFVPTLGVPVLDRLAPRAGERVLDVGCGDGTLTARLRDAGCTVVGIDASAAQVRAARALGLDARVLDAADLGAATDLGTFDAAFSNAALHWVPDQRRAIAGVAARLAPGGRFVAELGGAGNVAAVREALHAALDAEGVDPRPLDPWTFPDTATLRGHLEAAGLTVEVIDHFARPTPLPGPLADWLGTFAPPFLDALDAPRRARVVDAVVRACAPTLQDGDGRWTLDYVRLRLVARRDA
jgi:trans-aconitate methyltransferase